MILTRGQGDCAEAKLHEGRGPRTRQPGGKEKVYPDKSKIRVSSLIKKEKRDKAKFSGKGGVRKCLVKRGKARAPAIGCDGEEKEIV